MLSLAKLSAASALLFSAIASVAADKQSGGAINSSAWYAIWNNGQNFLSVDDITNKTDNSTHYLIGRFAPSAEDIELSTDMGQRFQFPQGVGGPVSTQLHAVHSIATTGDALGHWTSFGTDSSSFLKVVWIKENETIALMRDAGDHNDFVSVGGLVTPQITGWNYAEIAAVSDSD